MACRKTWINSTSVSRSTTAPCPQEQRRQAVRHEMNWMNFETKRCRSSQSRR